MSEYKEKYNKYITSGNAEHLNNWLQKLDEKTRKSLVPQIKNDLRRLYIPGSRRWAQSKKSDFRAVCYAGCRSDKLLLAKRYKKHS